MRSSHSIRVLLFEGQPAMTERLLRFFSRRPDMEITEAPASLKAFVTRPESRALLERLRPHAIVLDMEEPLQRDLLWAARLQELTSAPLIAFTSCPWPDREYPGLDLFAVVNRPEGEDEEALTASLRMLVYAIRRAEHYHNAGPEGGEPQPAVPAPPSGVLRELITIGASAGGTEAILSLLSSLPPHMPPILIVQHITPGFQEVFAAHIQRKTAFTVQVGRDGEPVRAGGVYLAPDHAHMRLVKTAMGYRLHCWGQDRISGHLPSVDALFYSAAKQAGNKAIGVLLTGMGKDGAHGLLEMRRAGALTIIQDEATSLIYGMPKSAYALGAADLQLPLGQIAQKLIKETSKGEQLW